MKPTLIAVIACGALLALAPLGARAQGGGSSQGGLRRMAPDPQNANPLEDLYARDFDRAKWTDRLTQPDLELREKSYEGLLRRARIDPLARAFLEELARDPDGGELAWTARLALRELGRASFPLFAPGGGALSLDPLGGDPFQRMQEMMSQLFENDQLGLVPLRAQRLGGSSGSASRGMRVEQGPDGARIHITELVDGEESTRTYEGQSLEQILRENPELQRDLNGLQLHVAPGSPLDLRLDLGGRLGAGPAREPGVPLLPQQLSRPRLLDRLGVIVAPVPEARARELGLENVGLLVETTLPETFASLMGVKAGDVLLQLQGEPLRTGADIERLMRGHRADEPVTLTWLDSLGQRMQRTWPQPEPPPEGPAPETTPRQAPAPR